MSPLILALVVAVLVTGPLLYFFNKKFNELQKPSDEGALKLMLQVVSDLRKEVEMGHGKNREELEKKLNQMTLLLQKHQSDTTQNLQKQLQASASIIQDVTKNLTQLQETNKQVVGFAQQMKSLENILKNPKQRGILGEVILETALSNLFAPGQYQMQYKMGNGEIADAVIFYNNLLIPIDAKFSLEKYNQMTEENDKERREMLEKAFKMDVKKRIDETSKYIRPSEGTTEFAFMFIPAEGIYYHLMIHNVGTINTQNLTEYAFEKRVILVSPTSFFAYLQTVLQGMKALEMGENVSKTLKNIEKLGKHMYAYDDYFKRLGKQLDSTVNTYNLASREFQKIDKDVLKLTDGQAGGAIEILELEGPAAQE